MQEIRETRARRTAKREVAGAVAAGAPPASPRKPGSQEHEEQDSKHESFEVPRITREYIRRQVSEIAPLLEECVEQSGPEHVDGKLQVNFIIDGEPGVGGLVRDAHIAQATFPLTPEFTRCVNETFMSIQVEPPEEGGFIKVRYPFYIQRSGRVEGAPPEAGAPG
jgi:hypothetical protein